MTYSETINYLYARLPMFTRIGAAAYKKDLHNTIALLEALDNPQQHFKTIHIAGTNGKGSTSHMLASILQQHGYKTGLYTSPHLVDFRERIKVNGDWVTENFIIEFTQRIKPVIEEVEPSFFEVTVAMAFEWFRQQDVDIAVIETGLGGRLDSTNVITPELSIITNIGWDHMNLLGDTLEKIAFEKAGIIKPHVPVVIGETLPETEPIFLAKAADTKSEIHFAQSIFSIEHVALQPEILSITFKNTQTKAIHTIQTDLPGLYQQFNLRTAITAVEVLMQKGWALNWPKTQEALLHTKALTGLHGRWELIHKNPLVVLDVAHNVNGIQQVLAQVEQLQLLQPNMQVHWIMGMVKDKDISKVLQLIPKDFHYYFTQAQLPRALPSEELQAMASTVGLTGSAFQNVNVALKAVLSRASMDDLIIVCGSVFVVGEVEKHLYTGS